MNEVISKITEGLLTADWYFITVFILLTKIVVEVKKELGWNYWKMKTIMTICVAVVTGVVFYYLGRPLDVLIGSAVIGIVIHAFIVGDVIDMMFVAIRQKLIMKIKNMIVGSGGDVPDEKK